MLPLCLATVFIASLADEEARRAELERLQVQADAFASQIAVHELRVQKLNTSLKFIGEEIDRASSSADADAHDRAAALAGTESRVLQRLRESRLAILKLHVRHASVLDRLHQLRRE